MGTVITPYCASPFANFFSFSGRLPSWNQAIVQIRENAKAVFPMASPVEVSDSVKSLCVTDEIHPNVPHAMKYKIVAAQMIIPRFDIQLKDFLISVVPFL